MPRIASTGSLLTISELVRKESAPLHPSFLREPAVPSQGAHSPPAERSAGAAPLRPAPGSEAHSLKRSLGPRRANVSFRTESRQPRTFSGALGAAGKKRERILAFVGVCGRECVKTRVARSRRSALSARPEPRASASLRRTPAGVGVGPLAGPSPSGSERAELRPRPRPSLGCSRPRVRSFSSGPASPPGGRPAAARGPPLPGSASAPGAREWSALFTCVWIATES